MIRHRSRRMTVAQLTERMDARFRVVDKRFRMVDKRFEAVDHRFDAIDERFDRLTARMDAGFLSLHDKLNAILRALNATDDNQQKIRHDHENRLRDLEASRPRRHDTAR